MYNLKVFKKLKSASNNLIIVGENMSKFKDKTILVTGASSGIGLAMAKDFANRGANLILTARSKDKLDQLASELEARGTSAKVFIEDISVPNSAQKLYNQIKAAQIDVDILVNNAGYGRWGTFDECPVEDYENMIHLNITSLTELSYLFLEDMEKKGSGGIINVASVAAFYSIPYSAVYAATKAYVLSLSEALNFEYSRKGIHIMAVCPGATESEFVNVATVSSERLQKRLSAMQDNKNVKIQSAEDCSKEALDAFENGKIYIITGRSNRNLYSLSRLFSRKRLLNWVGRRFKKISG
tara:strand:- start:1396 stop:2286 length:891 start_codon:yes stop_codon:yes gene_type:complete